MDRRIKVSCHPRGITNQFFGILVLPHHHHHHRQGACYYHHCVDKWYGTIKYQHKSTTYLHRHNWIWLIGRQWWPWTNCGPIIYRFRYKLHWGNRLTTSSGTLLPCGTAKPMSAAHTMLGTWRQMNIRRRRRQIRHPIPPTRRRQWNRPTTFPESCCIH